MCPGKGTERETAELALSPTFLSYSTVWRPGYRAQGWGHWGRVTRVAVCLDPRWGEHRQPCIRDSLCPGRWIRAPAPGAQPQRHPGTIPGHSAPTTVPGNSGSERQESDSDPKAKRSRAPGGRGRAHHGVEATNEGETSWLPGSPPTRERVAPRAGTPEASAQAPLPSMAPDGSGE